jgi:phage/plasmid primase-like uncharacterized protein
MSDAREQFRAAIAKAGLIAPRNICADGKLHRFSSDGRRGDDAGWYVFHKEDIPAGAFGCWRSDLSQTWRADIGRPLTAEELAATRRKMDDDKREREAEEKRNHERARKRAAKIWDNAAEAPADYPYLARKGVLPHEFGENRPEWACDFNDLHQHAGPEVVRACIERAISNLDDDVDAREDGAAALSLGFPLRRRE